MAKIINDPTWELDDLVNKIGYAADVLALLQMAISEKILGDAFHPEDVVFFIEDSLRTTEKQINDLLEGNTLVPVKKERVA